MIELRRGPDPAATPVAEARLFAPARVLRLREWMEAGQPRGVPPRAAKLLVVASDAGATRDFVRMLARVPGVEIDERFTTGSYRRRPPDARPHPVEENLGIELRLPRRWPSRFAPLWPLLGLQRSKALFLLLRRAGAPRRRGRAAGLADMRRLPRAHTFSRCAREGERGGCREVRENLSLLDQGSLFLIPLESHEKADRSARMLQRVLP
jgi:hypothetical protein